MAVADVTYHALDRGQGGQLTGVPEGVPVRSRQLGNSEQINFGAGAQPGRIQQTTVVARVLVDVSCRAMVVSGTVPQMTLANSMLILAGTGPEDILVPPRHRVVLGSV